MKDTDLDVKIEDQQGERLILALYKLDGCPFCLTVIQTIEELRIPMTYHDTLRDSGAREQLVRIGGKSQVPCLTINEKPLYESLDIVNFLRNEVRLVG